MIGQHAHRALVDCPVCGDRLVTTRLGCGGCGTELVGQFAPCLFCALDDTDLEALKVFLVSRGNLKELQSHLGVSYPTARARFNDLLDRLGWLAEADPDPQPAREGEGEPVASSGPGEPPDGIRDQVLAQVAAGVLSPAVAAELLAALR